MGFLYFCCIPRQTIYIVCSTVLVSTAYYVAGHHSWDWKKGGHKRICTELKDSIGTTSIDTIRDIILDLMAIENSWLSSLSNEEKRIVVGCVDGNIASRYYFQSGGGALDGVVFPNLRGASKPRVVDGARLLLKRFDAKNYSCVGKIALVLLRVNPCVHIAHRWDTSGFSKLYNSNVLQPWYSKHQFVLNSEGFKLHWATNRDINSDGPLFKDRRHPLIECANTIFPRPSKCSKNILGVSMEFHDVSPSLPKQMQWVSKEIQYAMFDCLNLASLNPSNGQPSTLVKRSLHESLDRRFDVGHQSKENSNTG